MSDIIGEAKARLVERIDSPADLLAFKLGSALNAEHRLLWTLDALASEAESLDVKDVLHHHVDETQSHIANVERALKAIGAEVDHEQPSPAIRGIDKDTSSNAEHASEEIVDAVILSGAAEIEHHESAVYETLITLGEALGRRDVVEALHANLEQEQHQLSKTREAFEKTVADLDLKETGTEGVLDKVKSKLSQKIESGRDLLAFNLGVALKMEETIVGMLGHLEQKARGAQLKHQLHDHLEETQGHIKNIESAFAALDIPVDKKPCRAIDAIEKEAKTSLKVTRDRMLDAVILSGAAETEHYEIAVYEALVELAEAVGAHGVVGPLRENLEQEQHMLGQVSTAMLTEARVDAGQSS